MKTIFIEDNTSEVVSGPKARQQLCIVSRAESAPQD
jgi:hypothetical protein